MHFYPFIILFSSFMWSFVSFTILSKCCFYLAHGAITKKYCNALIGPSHINKGSVNEWIYVAAASPTETFFSPSNHCCSFWVSSILHFFNTQFQVHTSSNTNKICCITSCWKKNCRKVYPLLVCKLKKQKTLKFLKYKISSTTVYCLLFSSIRG